MTTSPPSDSRIAPFVQQCKEMFSQRRLILVSNRGPVEYRVGENGELQARRGSGGVVTALSAASQYAELTWVAATMSEGDRLAAEKSGGAPIKSPIPGQNFLLKFVVCPRPAYHKYYNVFCNPLLWFLQHYMWNAARTPNINAAIYDAWENGYVPVNQAFADSVREEIRDDEAAPFIMLQDYHLYLAAGQIRSQVPNAILQHFTHIPWPAPRYWQLLPQAMRIAIHENMCANDIVGLQTLVDARNFLLTCDTFLEKAEVDYRRRKVWHNGHLTSVNPYPISIDVSELQRTARSSRVREYEERLRSHCGEHTIVRVDRAEPSKNIVRGFRAFEMLLESHPDLVGKVKFLAFLVPSRTHIRQYQRYNEEITALVEAINARYGKDGWKPIEVFYENNYLQAIAGMRLYDVLLVNAVIDGMNLVAKEGPTVNNRDGVLVLSDSVGAHEQLKDSVLTIAAADLEGTCRALYAALTMSAEERSSRAAALKKAIEGEDLLNWLTRQFEDMMTLA
ncbi:MAG: trehalose-6-phosphate synthase [Chloroflexi bacterium]|nr:trehalose-6-phosphate synthase [Chloroflexota bacterium]